MKGSYAYTEKQPQKTKEGWSSILVSVLELTARIVPVGIVTGYKLCGRGSIPGRVKRSDRLWDPPSPLSNGYLWALSLRVKRPWREAHHSHPSSTEVKNGAIPLRHTSSWRSA
jgi:hypothetical protein